MKEVDKWKLMSSLVFSSLLLNFWSFYNRFPIVFPDSGAYLDAGFQNAAPADRPIFYGWFLRHISLNDTLYLPLFVQGLMLSYLLWLWIYYFGWEKMKIAQFIMLSFVLTFFTGASIQVSQLLPDVFASMSILSAGLLLLAPAMKKRDLILTVFLLVTSMVMHNSHGIIIAGILFSLGAIKLYLFLKKDKRKIAHRWVLVLGCFVFAQLAIPTAHWMTGARFASSRASHVFLMNRMVDWGIIDQYLEDHCEEKAYKFCEFKDQIPRDNFIWNFDGSPLYKTGGWEANEEEYNEIIRGILSEPKFLIQLFLRVIEDTCKQFFSFAIGDTTRHSPENSLPHILVKKHFNELERNYFSSLQQHKHLEGKFETLNLHHRYLIGFSMCMAMVLLLMSKKTPKTNKLLGFILLGLFVNAAVCGSLSAVFDRYQCRVVFLIIIPLYLLIWQLPPIQSLINKFSSYEEQV
jgi:hypothetical protein